MFLYIQRYQQINKKWIAAVSFATLPLEVVMGLVRLTLDQKIVLTKTKDYKHLTKKMSEVSKFEFYNDISLSNKEYTIGIALALTMGWCGVHRFWLGDSKGGFIYLIFFWTLLPFIFSIVDAICMKRTCKKINNDHAVDAFKKYSEASLPI